MTWPWISPFSENNLSCVLCGNRDGCETKASLSSKCSVCQFLKLSPWLCSYLSFCSLQLNACVDLLGRLQPFSTRGNVFPVFYVSKDSSCRPAMSEPHLFRWRLCLTLGQSTVKIQLEPRISMLTPQFCKFNSA